MAAEKSYTRREFLYLAGKASLLAMFSGALRFETRARGEGAQTLCVNDLIQGEEQLQVIFLDRNNEQKSDAFLLLFLNETGLDVILHDGGLNDRRTYKALLQLREEVLARAGIAGEAADQYALRMKLVISHFHMDHTEGLYGLILRTKRKLQVEAAYLPPCAGLQVGLYSDAHNGDTKHRPKFLEAMEKFQPQGSVHTLAFAQSQTVPTRCGKVRVFAPVNDWSAPDKMRVFDEEYGYIHAASRMSSLPIAALNANSMWLHAQLQGAAFLFTGDTEKRLSGRHDEAMDEMIAAYGDALRTDVIKYPHHGISRNAAAAVIREHLVSGRGESVCILTAKDGARQGGAALEDVRLPWMDLESGSIRFTVHGGALTHEICGQSLLNV